MRKIVALSLATTLALTLAACSSEADTSGASSEETIVLQVGTVIAGDTSPVLKSFAELEKNLEERSNGKFDVQIFPASQLGAAQEITEMCRGNDIQVATVHTPSVSATLTDLAVIEQFYLFDDVDHAINFYKGEGGEKLLDAYNQMGLEGIGYMPIGARELSNNKHVVDDFSDLSGLKIRGYNQIQIAAWEAVGSSLSAVSWNELFTSMQQKLIDGQETSIVNFTQEKFYEVQPYVTLTGHQVAADVLVVNQDFLDSLNEEDRALLLEELNNVITMQNEEVIKQTEELSKTLTNEHGVTITEPSEELINQMKDVMIPASKEEILKVCDQAFYDEIIGYVEEARN